MYYCFCSYFFCKQYSYYLYSTSFPSRFVIDNQIVYFVEDQRFINNDIFWNYSQSNLRSSVMYNISQYNSNQNSITAFYKYYPEYSHGEFYWKFIDGTNNLFYNNGISIKQYNTIQLNDNLTSFNQTENESYTNEIDFIQLQLTPEQQEINSSLISQNLTTNRLFPTTTDSRMHLVLRAGWTNSSTSLIQNNIPITFSIEIFNASDEISNTFISINNNDWTEFDIPINFISDQIKGYSIECLNTSVAFLDINEIGFIGSIIGYVGSIDNQLPLMDSIN